MGHANKLLGWFSNNGAEINGKGAQLIVDVPANAPAFVTVNKTGIIAAAAAAGACIFAMRLSPTAGTTKAYIDTIRLRFTTVAAFTVPVTATRSLVLTRGIGAATASGTAVPAMSPKESSYAASFFDAAQGGDVRIGSTAALTVVGITWEVATLNLGEATLIHCGAAGGFYETVYEFSVRSHPIELLAGQLLGIRVGSAAMDAGGTWVLGTEVSWYESSSYAG